MGGWPVGQRAPARVTLSNFQKFKAAVTRPNVWPRLNGKPAHFPLRVTEDALGLNLPLLAMPVGAALSPRASVRPARSALARLQLE